MEFLMIDIHRKDFDNWSDTISKIVEQKLLIDIFIPKDEQYMIRLAITSDTISLLTKHSFICTYAKLSSNDDMTEFIETNLTLENGGAK